MAALATRSCDLNPAGLSPVYVEDSGACRCRCRSRHRISRRNTGQASAPLIPGNALARAEVRRLVAWFDVKFYAEVTEPVLTEKVIRRFVAATANGRGSPRHATHAQPACRC